VSNVVGEDGASRSSLIGEDRGPDTRWPLRRRRRITGVATWVTLTLVVAIGLEIALAATSPSIKAAPKPAKILSDSLVAAGGAASFHYRAVWQTGGMTQTIVGDAGLSSGMQSVSFGGAQFSVVLIDRVIYVRGDSAALRDQLGLATTTASADAGKWIALQQSDGPYQSIEQGVTTETALSQILIAPRVLSTHLHRGSRTLRIAGPIPPGTRGQVITGSARLDMAARSKLPSLYLGHGRNGGQPWSASITFTQWGEGVPVTPPPAALPYGSLLATASGGR
jgi:hypothetical protein